MVDDGAGRGERDRIAVVGAGAVGLWLAAHLAEAGNRVTLLCRREKQCQVIGERGIRWVSARGETTVFPECRPVSRGFPREVDWMAVCVKGEDRDRVDPGPAGWPPVPVLRIQNGVDLLRIPRSWGVPPSRYAAGVLTYGLMRPDDRTVEVRGEGTLTIGVPGPPGEPPPFLRRMEQVLREAGIAAAASPDLAREVWRKAAANAAINGLTALLECCNGEILHRSAVRAVAADVVREVGRLAARAGVAETEETLWSYVLEVIRATARNRSSMLQDWEFRRRPEWDAVYGDLLKAAEEAGVSVPVLATVARLVQSKFQNIK